MINTKRKASIIFALCLVQFAPLVYAQNGLMDELKSKIDEAKSMAANAKRWPVELEFTAMALCLNGDETKMNHSLYMAKMDACFCGLKQAEEQKSTQQILANSTFNEVAFTSLIVRNARSSRCLP